MMCSKQLLQTAKEDTVMHTGMWRKRAGCLQRTIEAVRHHMRRPKGQMKQV